jgi:hypothetical protein
VVPFILVLNRAFADLERLHAISEVPKPSPVRPLSTGATRQRVALERQLGGIRASYSDAVKRLTVARSALKSAVGTSSISGLEQAVHAERRRVSALQAKVSAAKNLNKGFGFDGPTPAEVKHSARVRKPKGGAYVRRLARRAAARLAAAKQPVAAAVPALVQTAPVARGPFSIPKGALEGYKLDSGVLAYPADFPVEGTSAHVLQQGLVRTVQGNFVEVRLAEKAGDKGRIILRCNSVTLKVVTSGTIDLPTPHALQWLLFQLLAIPEVRGGR